MKKLNNRGFAISTVLYSLLIMIFLIVALMLSIMSSTRSNSKDLINEIETDLNRFSLTETIFLPSLTGTATGQMYVVPEKKSGWYKIELWGASGGDNTKKGGKGAYTSGLLYLNSNDKLYFYVGSQGNNKTGGENGGGAGNGTGTGGGGATDVRVIPGAWNDASSLNSRIMVASGGGGATTSKAGGIGNALFGYDSTDTNLGKAGSQTNGGVGTTEESNGKLGLGGIGISNGSGGGSGYFGGSGGTNNPGGGGSSYISGFSKTTPKELKFLDGKMLENTNEGNGKAKISYVSENDKNNFPLTNINTNLNKVKYIKDCVQGTGIDINNLQTPLWNNIEILSNGINVSNKGTISDTIDGPRKCKLITLTAEYNIDDIAIWHFDNNETDIKKRVLYNHTLEVAGTDNVYRKIIDIPEGSLSMPEGLLGTRSNSRWSHDMSKDMLLPDGTYYISTALNPHNAFLTANDNKTVDKNGDGKIDTYDNLSRDIYLSDMNGSNLQKWVILRKENNSKAYYEIREKETFQPMYITNIFAEQNTSVITKQVDDNNSDFIKWNIVSLGDGTYTISSLIQPFDFAKDYYTTLSTYMNNYGANNGTVILRNKNQINNTSNRFYLINAYK